MTLSDDTFQAKAFATYLAQHKTFASEVSDQNKSEEKLNKSISSLF